VTLELQIDQRCELHAWKGRRVAYTLHLIAIVRGHIRILVNTWRHGTGVVDVQGIVRCEISFVDAKINL